MRSSDAATICSSTKHSAGREGSGNVKIAAILSVPETAEGSSAAPGFAQEHDPSAWDVRVDVLGKSLLQRAVEKIAALATCGHAIISHPEAEQWVSRSADHPSAAFVEPWENAVLRFVQGGADVLLLSRLNVYADLDYGEFFNFHLQTGAPVTQVYADDGALDVALVNASHLRNVDGIYRRALSALVPRQRRFYYGGYVNRLASPQDFYRLVSDGLRGRCKLLPAGTEIQPSVWQGDLAAIDASVVVNGPVFIGAGSRIAASCTVAPNTAIERDCQIDFGSSVQESWIQQNTYVGVALDVRGAIVANDTLFHLDRNVKLKLAEHHLIGAAANSAPWLSGLGSFLWNERAT